MAAPKYYVYASTGGLAITDGTTAGTSIIKPAGAGFSPDIWMALLGTGDEVVFGASAGGTGAQGSTDQLWLTDGTTADTTLVTTLPTAAVAGTANHGAGITGLVSFGGGVLFNYATGADAANSLYYSDGTAAGTIALPDSQNAFGSPAAVLAGRMLFVSASGLCETDGTVAGTTVIKAVDTAAGGFVPDSSVFSTGTGSAMFLASAGAGVYAGGTAGVDQLWITNGTAAGTTLVTTLPDNSGAMEAAQGFAVGAANGRVFFAYSNGASGYNIYASDGTAAGTVELPDSAGGFGGVPAPGGKFVFVSASGICVTDGTVAGTAVLKASSATFAPVGNFTTLANGDVLFSAGPSGVTGQYGLPGGDTQLWITDGTAAGTSLVETLPDQSGSTTDDTAVVDPVGGLTAGYLLDYATGGSGQAGGLNLYGSSGTAAATVALPNSANSLDLADYDTAFLPCFVRGTRIATARGEVAVEDLAVGDRVRTVSGREALVRWLGRRRVACRRHARPAEVLPVRIAAGAFAAEAPRRDLWLSPDHAVFVEGVLIPVKHLCNGSTIVRMAVDAVEYWHVELDRHDVLLAEGLAAESYLDTGNRAAFSGGAASLLLHPGFAALSWDDACAELVQHGPALGRVKAALFRRSGINAGRPRLSLRVRAGSRELPPEAAGPGVWRYRVPEAASFLTLCSASWVPAHCVTEALDQRPLGIRLFQVECDGRVLALTDQAFASGFHAPECTTEGWCRWTDGRAKLALPFDTKELKLAVGNEAEPQRQAA